MNFSKLHTPGLYLMATFYIAAGINHFLNSAMYLTIMPSWLPHKLSLVYVSGVCEIVLGILLIPEGLRRFSAWGIILLLIVVYPANIQMLINYYRDNNQYLWLALLRLPLQFVLIWWAYGYAKKRRLKAF